MGVMPAGRRGPGPRQLCGAAAMLAGAAGRHSAETLPGGPPWSSAWCEGAVPKWAACREAQVSLGSYCRSGGDPSAGALGSAGLPSVPQPCASGVNSAPGRLRIGQMETWGGRQMRGCWADLTVSAPKVLLPQPVLAFWRDSSLSPPRPPSEGWAWDLSPPPIQVPGGRTLGPR